MTIYFDHSNPHSSQKFHLTDMEVLFGGPGLAFRDLLGFFFFSVVGISFSFKDLSRVEKEIYTYILLLFKTGNLTFV